MLQEFSSQTNKGIKRENAIYIFRYIYYQIKSWDMFHLQRITWNISDYFVLKNITQNEAHTSLTVDNSLKNIG
jgi:hypothetical protein